MNGHELAQVEKANAALDRAYDVLMYLGGLEPVAAADVVYHMPWNDIPSARWAEDGALTVARALMRDAARCMETIANGLYGNVTDVSLFLEMARHADRLTRELSAEQLRALRFDEIYTSAKKQETVVR